MTKGSGASKPATRPLVLVVDDGRQHVTLLRLALMQRGFAVIVVLSEEGARTMLREKSIDAMVVTLPLDAGTSLVSSLGEARPPVVLAVTSAEERVRAEGGGFDLALARPIDFAELDGALRDRMALRTSGTRRRVRAKKPATT